ncbi:amidohydrolase family protein [Flagellimonas meishanensis]|uniref:amidohydrolase family protein n=1 Tax=Flagellimonas meishanensis TaxID=2873264 RepID=UPI001CA63666|nr:amidohydrolase family protein [[Muricauda] meishanensis]
MKVRFFDYFLVAMLLCGCQENEQLVGDTLITNVNIVDVESGKIIPEQDVLISGERIKSIRPSKKARYTAPNQINGAGKYMIPGLWDMHAHPDDPEVWRMDPKTEEKDRLLPLFVINGVTGIRDMGGDIDLVKRWRENYASGELFAPKIFAGGPLLDGPNPMWDGSVGIEGPEQVKNVVDSLINAGVDFLKVYSLLPRETYLELSKYANEIDFPFVGHVPFTVPPSEAAATGMKSQEHLLEILKECAAEPNEEFMNALGKMENRIDRSNKMNDFRLNTFDRIKADSLYTTFKKHGIWHCPTLSMWQKNAWYEQEWEKDLGHTELLPPYLRAYWTPEHNDHLQNRDNEDYIKTKQRLYGLYQEMVREMNKKGVLLLAGTDVGANPLCHPGVGVHNELEALVQAGLTPSEALKTATLNPAIFFKIQNDYGSVSEGKIADLVLLNGNPLEQMDNTRKIDMVIREGNVLGSERIAEIKNGIRAANLGTWEE